MISRSPYFIVCSVFCVHSNYPPNIYTYIFPTNSSSHISTHNFTNKPILDHLERNMSRNQAQTGYTDTSSRLDTKQHRNPITYKGGVGLAATQPSIAEEGFITVSRAKAPSKIISPTRPNDRTGRPPKTNGAPSAAAVSRAGIYQRQQSKAPSGYKQSCLPVDERDPVLLEIERNKGVKLPKNLFKPGIIVRAALHEPSFGGTSVVTDATDGDKYTTDSKYGTIHTKYRKFIVLALFKNHYLAMPLYTHNGRGLEGKLQPDEYVSVQDHRDTAPFTKLSSHEPLVTAQINAGIGPFHPKTTAHLTYLVPRNYDVPVVHEGFLDNKSLTSLNKLFHKQVGGMVPH